MLLTTPHPSVVLFVHLQRKAHERCAINHYSRLLQCISSASLSQSRFCTRNNTSMNNVTKLATGISYNSLLQLCARAFRTYAPLHANPHRSYFMLLFGFFTLKINTRRRINTNSSVYKSLVQQLFYASYAQHLLVQSLTLSSKTKLEQYLDMLSRDVYSEYFLNRDWDLTNQKLASRKSTNQK